MIIRDKEMDRLYDLCKPYYRHGYTPETGHTVHLAENTPDYVKEADKKWKQIYDDIEAAIMKDWGSEVIRRG